MGFGIFIKMTLGVVRKEFGLHGWRAKHPTWGTTKELLQSWSPWAPSRDVMLFPLSVVVRGVVYRCMWRVRIIRHLSE